MARILLNQLASAPKQEAQNPTWYFELPYHQGDKLEILQLTVSREKPESVSGHKPIIAWSVILELEPENLGKVRIKLVLHEEKISSFFWTEKASSRSLLEAHFEQLAQRFLAAGLEPDSLQWAQRIDNTQPDSPPSSSLIHEKI